MQFIKAYKAFNKDFCDALINNFKTQKELGCVTRRDDRFRRDNQLDQHPGYSFSETDLRNTKFAKHFFEGVNKAKDKYIADLGASHTLGKTHPRNMLIQSYDADKYESYSAWHCEACGGSSGDRAFVFVVYLNDDFEGGETEFMYQKHKEKPGVGKVVFFPAGYTHTHRGAMVMKGTKYIATGWIFF